MLVSCVAHANGTIVHRLVVHLHGRCPTSDDELLLVARGMVVAACVTQTSQFLSQRRRFLFRVRVEKILQLEPTLVSDAVIPELGKGLWRHRKLSRTVFGVCRL